MYTIVGMHIQCFETIFVNKENTTYMYMHVSTLHYTVAIVLMAKLSSALAMYMYIYMYICWISLGNWHV